MSKIFLKLEDPIVRENFISALSSCGVEVVDDENKYSTDYILDDSKKELGLRLLQKNGTVIDIFQQPVDISHVVKVLERLEEEVPLWEGCPIVVNFSTGIARCVRGRCAGQHTYLTDLQQKVLKGILPAGRLGIGFDDLCIIVYGKVDIWSKTNLEMAIYNLNNRLHGFIDKPKVIVKTWDNKGNIRFVY